MPLSICPYKENFSCFYVFSALQAFNEHSLSKKGSTMLPHKLPRTAAFCPVEF